MSVPHVLVLFNRPVLAPDHPDYESEADVLYSTKVVRDSLNNLRIPSSEYGVSDDISALLNHLQQHRPDVIFNLYEGQADRAVTEVYLAGLLEWLEIPYTGCPAECLILARNKVLAKRLFLAAGVPTPRFAVVAPHSPVPENPVGWPAIVKPAEEDASVGIEQASVVNSPEELRNRVEFLRDHYGGTVLVEEFILGRELHVSVVDLHATGQLVALPLGELVFQKTSETGRWPIYSYSAKWNEHCEEYKNTTIQIGVKLAPEVQSRLIAAAERAFETLGCRGYARVDARVTDSGEVFVLEVNPNPSIYSILIDEALPAIGSNYDAFIGALVRAASVHSRSVGARRKRIALQS